MVERAAGATGGADQQPLARSTPGVPSPSLFPAAVVVDTVTAEVTWADPTARALCGAELPCDARRWVQQAGLAPAEDPDGTSPLLRVARGLPADTEPLLLAAAEEPTRPSMWVTGCLLPDATVPQAVLVLLPVPAARSAEVGHEVQSRALLAARLSITISDPTLPDNPLVWVNPAFTAMTGYDAEEMLGRNCRYLQGRDTDRAAVEELRRGIAQRTAVQCTLLNYRKDGTAFWNEVSVSPVFDASGDLTHFVGVQSDVTARVEAEQQRAAHLRAEHAARRRAERVQERMSLLADATTTLAATLDVDEALHQLVGLVVPRLADWCLVDLAGTDGNGQGFPVVATHTDPDREGLVRRLERLRRGRLDPDTVVPGVLADGPPQLLRNVPAASLRSVAGSDALARLYEELGCSSVMVVPLRARHQVLGTLTLVRSGRRDRYDEDDLDATVDLAGRAALIVDNARLYAREHEVAEALQRSMLPRVPDIPGLEVCARYLPGTVGAQVGGDWYDVLHLPDGSVGIAVGDVMGHDLSAAAAMGQLRSVLRSYAWQRQSPAEVLDSLDQLVQGLEMAQLATAVFGRLELLEDAAEGAGGARLRWANAGHLPPLVVLPDGTVEQLSAAWSVLIGAPGGTPRPESTVLLPPGSVLVLYTDGLVESRRTDVEAGLERLMSVLADVADAPSADEMCDRLLGNLHPASREDDVALLAVRLVPDAGQAAPVPPERSTLEVPAVPASASRVRRHCHRVLADAPGDVRETVVLLASELVSNAITHAAGPITLRVDHGPRVVRVEVADRTPHLPVPPPTRDDGDPEGPLDSRRGLVLLEALATSWGAVPTSSGKRVWFEVAVTGSS